MPSASRSNCLLGISFVVLLVGASSCSLESPVSVTNRPLAEQLEERDGQLAAAARESSALLNPEALAFNEALDEGALVRLRITEEGIPAALHSGPASAYEVLSEIPAGSEVLATGNQTGEWVHVVYGDFDGWVSTVRIAFDDSAPNAQQIVTADVVGLTPVTYVVVGEAIGVNIRAEPDGSSELVSGASVGSHVVGTGNTEGAWVEVVFDGVTGWASGNYLEATGFMAPGTTGEQTQNRDE